MEHRDVMHPPWILCQRGEPVVLPWRLSPVRLGRHHLFVVTVSLIATPGHLLLGLSVDERDLNLWQKELTNLQN